MGYFLRPRQDLCCDSKCHRWLPARTRLHHPSAGRLALRKKGDVILDLVQLLWQPRGLSKLCYRGCCRAVRIHFVHWTDTVPREHFSRWDMCDCGEYRSCLPRTWTLCAICWRLEPSVQSNNPRAMLLQSGWLGDGLRR